MAVDSDRIFRADDLKFGCGISRLWRGPKGVTCTALQRNRLSSRRRRPFEISFVADRFSDTRGTHKQSGTVGEDRDDFARALRHPSPQLLLEMRRHDNNEQGGSFHV